MKKRKKSKDDFCLVSLFKTALFIGIFLWGNCLYVTNRQL